jgi:hypothetical protein
MQRDAGAARGQQESGDRVLPPRHHPEERATLIDTGYIQHNPAFKKFADENKISYYEGFNR